MKATQITSRTAPPTGAMLTSSATASAPREIATGLMSTAGWNRTVSTCRSWGSRCLSTVWGTRSKLGAILMPTLTSYVRDEIREALCDIGKQARDVVDQVRRVGWLLHNPPYGKGNHKVGEDLLHVHCRLPGTAN